MIYTVLIVGGIVAAVAGVCLGLIIWTLTQRKAEAATWE